MLLCGWNKNENQRIDNMEGGGRKKKPFGGGGGDRKGKAIQRTAPKTKKKLLRRRVPGKGEGCRDNPSLGMNTSRAEGGGITGKRWPK